MNKNVHNHYHHLEHDRYPGIEGTFVWSIVWHGVGQHPCEEALLGDVEVGAAVQTRVFLGYFVLQVDAVLQVGEGTE